MMRLHSSCCVQFVHVQLCMYDCMAGLGIVCLQLNQYRVLFLLLSVGQGPEFSTMRNLFLGLDFCYGQISL